MIGMEKCLAVRQFCVGCQYGINQIANGAFCCTPHFHGNISQCIKVIVDDGLTGDREDLTVRGQRDSLPFITRGDVLILRTFANLTQRRETAHTDTMSGFKVAQAAFFRPQFEGF